MTTTDITYKLKLVDGQFTPSEASDVLHSLIKQKINFHKLHRLSLTEGNMNCETHFDDSRLAQLLKEQSKISTVIDEARLANKNIRINGILDVEILD